MNDQQILKTKIQQYIEFHNMYLRKLDEFNSLREEKNNMQDDINEQLKNMNIENKTFILDNHKIQHKTIIQYQQFSLKYIKDCLQEVQLNDEKINEIIDTLKKNRITKLKKELKLTYNDK